MWSPGVGEGKDGLSSRAGQTHGSVLVTAVHAVIGPQMVVCRGRERSCGPLDPGLKSMKGDLKEHGQEQKPYQEAVGSEEQEGGHQEHHA